LEAAKKSGDSFDLCDSEAEVPVQLETKVKSEINAIEGPFQPKVKVKSEIIATAAAASSSQTTNRAVQSIIDLCESSDDEWIIPPAPSFF